MREAIENAIQHWQNETCVAFEYMTQSEIAKTRYGKRHKYVMFVNGDGYVELGRGRQPTQIAGHRFVSEIELCD